MKMRCGAVLSVMTVTSQFLLPAMAEEAHPTMKLDGRIAIDAGLSHDGNETINGSEIRLLWLGAKGKVSDDVSYRVLLGFEGNKTSIKDAIITYTGIDNVKLMAGNFKAFTGIENMSSNLHLTFIERSNGIKPFRPIRRMGFGATYASKHMSVAGGIFGGDLNNINGVDQPWSVSGRVVGAPILSEDGRNVLHLGVSTYREMTPADDHVVKYSGAGETHVINEKLVSTGSINGAETAATNAVEALFIAGPFSVMSEYSQTTVGRDSMPDLDYSGGYANVSYFLTGEQRSYKVADGTVGRVKPNHPVDEGGRGAFEVAARYTTLDLLDDGISAGGEMDSVTVGVNWYPDSRIKLMANHVINSTSGGTTVPDYEPQYSMLRMQVDF
ncbi:OprO/OprP family phosphate-selective porin [Parvularcula sp. LCG005]|uniref:OprO/OprP family phosphate-selective porin n=1 Tax=Parvularcula sp. LCG005 TaxID=3078805 RepID=UPI002943D2F7|nr:porin [Parvularcula sp. LCG005]WOI53488.1 porin [Parvularcula sp. LCG005]